MTCKTDLLTVYVQAQTCRDLLVYIYMHILHICIRICVYIYICVSVLAYIYVYLHAGIYTYICNCMYIYIYPRWQPSLAGNSPGKRAGGAGAGWQVQILKSQIDTRFNE